MSWNKTHHLTPYMFSCHAPRERVSWNPPDISSIWHLALSRSTWACELKLSIAVFRSPHLAVTLHVSVWVEISWKSFTGEADLVTLHVSVWVEIVLAWDKITQAKKSRSTWACELKSKLLLSHSVRPPRHAPRERVSWNDFVGRFSKCNRVTLHVSVWVEIIPILN